MDSIKTIILEEIALEGLDGITIETLFLRLSQRLKGDLDEIMKNEVWKTVIKLKVVEFYEIGIDRETPQIFNRDDFHKVSLTEIDMESFKRNYFIYSFHPVDHPNVRGSCQEFKTRKNVQASSISSNLSEVLEKYKRKLVIVANQSLRTSILQPKNLGIEVEINNLAYCTLERIGRARHFGELSSGACSINEFIKDNKNIHYIRNQLLRNNLICRQQFQTKERKTSVVRFLMQLPMFFKSYQRDRDANTKLFEFLKAEKGCIAELDKAMSLFEKSRKNVVQFLKKSPYFDVDYKYPFRKLYPESKNYLNKSKGEKFLTVVRLKDPEMVKIGNPDGEEDAQTEEKFLDISNQVFGLPLAHQIYKKIEESGKEGLTQHEIATYFGLSRLNARSVIRKLKTTREIEFYTKDEGRQRFAKYVTKQFGTAAKEEVVAVMGKFLPTQTSHENKTSESPKLNKSKKKSPMKGTEQIVEKHPEIDEKYLEFETEAIPGVLVHTTMKIVSSIPGYENSLIELEKQNKISVRTMGRVNSILEIVKKSHLVEINHMLNLIRQTEKDLKESICKKSLNKIVSSVADKKLVKIVEMNLKCDAKSMRVLFVCDDTIHLNKKTWNGIVIEKVKMLSNPGSIPEIPSSMFKEPSEEKLANFKPIQNKNLGISPKFKRMKILHEFIFFMCYEIQKNYAELPIAEMLEQWKIKNPKLANIEDLEDEIKICHFSELDWKTFMTPLTKRQKCSDGWSLMHEIIFRMPLILISKLSFKVLSEAQKHPDMQYYLYHPIKCNYPLYFLPEDIRNKFLMGRRLCSQVNEICKRLCLCGLLKFGPARGKEVEQSLIYLNRKASLLDTSKSDPGYLEVSNNDYEKLEFTFNSLEDISHFWNKLFDISMNTPLNKKSLSNSDNADQDLSLSKIALQNFLKPIDTEAAEEKDNGELIGDRKGAGGLDKAFMSHLVRNWVSGRKEKKDQDVMKTMSEKIRRVMTKKLVSQARNRHSKKSKKKTVLKLNENSKAISRKVRPRSDRLHNDKIDDAILSRCKTSRSSWSESEDKSLLLIKVALKYMFNDDFPNINYSVVRDILHWKNERSINKTTKSCMRRITNLMKKDNSRERVVLHLEELNNTPEQFHKFRNIADRLKKKFPPSKLNEILSIAIVEFVILLHHMFYKQINIRPFSDSSVILPSNFDEIIENFTIRSPLHRNHYDYTEPDSIEKIEVSVLQSLIISVINSFREKSDYATLVIEVFQTISDDIVRSAISKLRQNSLVSLNKRDRNNSYMSNTITSFFLSPRYIQVMTLHIQVTTFEEILKIVEKLNSNDQLQINEVSCGMVLLMSEMLSSKQIELSYEKTEKLVTVDPQLRRKSPDFEKISEIYLENQTTKIQGKRRVKLMIGEANDETFIFNQDPIEWFLRCNPIFYHIFCIIVNMGENKEVIIKNFEIQDNCWCSLKTCIFQDENDFDTICKDIAESSLTVIEQILASQDETASDLNYITKSNLMSFYDGFVRSNIKEPEKQKDVFKESSKKRQKITTREVLVRMMDLVGSISTGEESWILDYKKKTKRNNENICDFDEENSSDPIKYQNMSHQLKELDVNHRIYDSFVVNFSTIHAHVKNNLSRQFFNNDIRNEVKELILKTSVWDPEEFTKSRVKSSNKISTDRKLFGKVVEFIKSKKQDGAKIDELKREFSDDHETLSKIVDELVETKEILRTGVNQVRFVHKTFAHFWMTSTFKNVQKKSSDDVSEPVTKKRKTESLTSERHTIFICTAPWIRINGTVSRRVLDKWLAVLLIQIHSNPGILIKDLAERFNVLKPFEVQCLCEILEKIGCIRLKSFKKSSDINLFSSLSTDDLEINSSETSFTLYHQHELFVEGTDNAMQRFSVYIGKDRNSSKSSQSPSIENF